jgi:hypothetical protein
MLTSLDSLLRCRRRRRWTPLVHPTVPCVAPSEPLCGTCGEGCGLPSTTPDVEGVRQIICPTMIGATCGSGAPRAPWSPLPGWSYL